METNMSHLPQEVLSHIISFLDVSQRLTAGLVCKSWLQASNSPQVLEDVNITVSSCTCLQQLPGTIRKFSNLTISSMAINDEFIDILSHLGSHLLHLCIYDCGPSTSLSRKVVCPYLISLKVEGNADFLLHVSSLPRLRKLFLRFTSSLTDRIFTPLDDIVGLNLETFSISNEVVWDPKVCRRFLLKGSGLEGKSDAILPCDTIESFMKKRAKTLTDLEFPRPISKEAAVRLSKIGGMSLRHISFRNCLECCKGVLPEVCTNQLLLVSIDVTGMLFLSDEDIIGVCQVLPNLQRFVACSCHINTCVPFLFRLKHLRQVDLSSCYMITPDSFTAAVDTFASHELQYLKLSGTLVQDAHLDNILIHVPCLKYLHLDECSGISKQMNVAALFEQLPNLLELSVCLQSEEEVRKGKEISVQFSAPFHFITRVTLMI